MSLFFCLTSFCPVFLLGMALIGAKICALRCLVISNAFHSSNKTLFSDRGATLRHGTLNIDGSHNIIIRNLKFLGLWEWDDSTGGNYDLQGWDFIALTNGASNVWIDHCDFAKVYDGQVDIVRGSDLVTVSYCRFTGDLGDEAANQINYLESLYRANPADSRIRYYRSQRDSNSVQEIITHEIPQ